LAMHHSGKAGSSATRPGWLKPAGFPPPPEVPPTPCPQRPGKWVAAPPRNARRIVPRTRPVKMLLANPSSPPVPHRPVQSFRIRPGGKRSFPQFVSFEIARSPRRPLCSVGFTTVVGPEIANSQRSKIGPRAFSGGPTARVSTLWPEAEIQSSVATETGVRPCARGVGLRLRPPPAGWVGPPRMPNIFPPPPGGRARPGLAST